jgi:hypothetical protein
MAIRMMRRLNQAPLSVRALVAVNLGLLALIAGAGISRIEADAQEAQGRRPRGEYTMISAKTNQGGPHAIWVVDASNQEMIVLKWDQSRQMLLGLGYRGLEGDVRLAPGR